MRSADRSRGGITSGLTDAVQSRLKRRVWVPAVSRSLLLLSLLKQNSYLDASTRQPIRDGVITSLGFTARARTRVFGRENNQPINAALLLQLCFFIDAFLLVKMKFSPSFSGRFGLFSVFGLAAVIMLGERQNEKIQTFCVRRIHPFVWRRQSVCRHRSASRFTI